MQNTRKGHHLGATKIEKINIFFEHNICFTIFCLLSDCITKVCFLLFFDTKLWFCFKKVEKPQKYFLSAAKSIEKFFFLEHHIFSSTLSISSNCITLNFKKKMDKTQKRTSFTCNKN